MAKVYKPRRKRSKRFISKTGRWIEDQRRIHSLTLEDLAGKVGISISYLSKLECGDGVIVLNLETLRKIGEAFRGRGSYLEMISILLQDKYGLTAEEIISLSKLVLMIEERDVLNKKITEIGKVMVD